MRGACGIPTARLADKMERIAVTCLGSGAALGRDRMWSSLLLDGRILLSLPPTVVPQLYRLGKDPTTIDHIFISHCHADHYFGLPFFLLLYHYLYERKPPLYIIGPGGIKEATARLCDLAWPELRKCGIAPQVPILFVEIEEEGCFQAGDIAFQAVKLEHFGLEAYGYRFAYKGREIVFTGDTGECSQLDRLLDGAQVVILEFTHPDDAEDAGHLNAATVSRLTERLREQGATVLATHLSGEPQSIEGLIICHDGETYLV